MMRARRVVGWLAGIAVLAVVFCTSFNWAWFKPAIQRYVAEHAGRQIDFDELHFGLTSDLAPTVRLRRLTITNAPWADPVPLISAGELQFIFAWKSLVDEHTIVSLLVLRDATVDLERQADGHRNWRLHNPDDTGPGKLRVLTLQAERSSVRFLHQGIALDLHARTDALGAPVVLPGFEALPLTKTLALEGSRYGQPFDAHLEVSELLTLFDTGHAFALRGEARSGSARLRALGTLTDVAMFGGADAKLELDGRQPNELRALILGQRTTALPAMPYSASAQLRTAGGRTTFSGLKARLGDSDLGGELSYQRHDASHPRPRWDAVLAGEALDPIALAKGVASGHAPAPAVQAPSRPASGVSPSEPLAAFRRFDIDLALRIARLTWTPTIVAEQLQLHTTLVDGQLDLAQATATLAGGRVSAKGQLRVDADAANATLNAQMSAQALSLGQLLAGLPDTRRVGGQLNAQAELTAHGATPDAWLASASGSVKLALAQASIADRLEAELALNGGAVLRSLVGTRRQVPLRCASATLRLRDGVLRSQRLGAATDRVELIGQASVSLHEKTLALLLTPRLKEHALLALDKSIRIDGPWSQPHLHLVERVELPASEGCEAINAGR